MDVLLALMFLAVVLLTMACLTDYTIQVLCPLKVPARMALHRWQGIAAGAEPS